MNVLEGVLARMHRSDEKVSEVASALDTGDTRAAITAIKKMSRPELEVAVIKLLIEAGHMLGDPQDEEMKL